MQYGICNLSIIPVRIEPNDTTEMVSQVLFGEHFKVLELRKNWSKIRVAFDNYEGWIDNKQYEQISEEIYSSLESSVLTQAAELIDFATDKNNQFSTVCMGSNLPFYNTKTLVLNTKKFHYDGAILNSKIPKNSIIDIAYKFLNTPFLWGGKTSPRARYRRRALRRREAPSGTARTRRPPGCPSVGHSECRIRDPGSNPDTTQNRAGRRRSGIDFGSRRLVTHRLCDAAPFAGKSR